MFSNEAAAQPFPGFLGVNDAVVIPRAGAAGESNDALITFFRSFSLICTFFLLDPASPAYGLQSPASVRPLTPRSH